MSVEAKPGIAAAPNRAEPTGQSRFIPTAAIKTQSNLKPSLQVFPPFVYLSVDFRIAENE